MRSLFPGARNDTSSKEEAPSSPVTILVVGDEDPARMFVERVLSGAGYQTATASDGPETLEVAAKLGHFDVLVTDFSMPQMSGDELARRLRQNRHELKVLCLTGDSDGLFREKSTLCQGEAFLDKPCSVKGLREAVSLLLSGRLDASRDGAM